MKRQKRQKRQDNCMTSDEFKLEDWNDDVVEE
jgi:hypothetical protein